MSIDYYAFLDDKTAPMEFNFHLVRFVGDTGSYGLGVPNADAFLGTLVNWGVSQSILYHEFSHLLDASDSSFLCNKAVYLSMPDDSNLRHVFLDLRNAYIDKRLQRALGGEYAIRPT